MTEQMEGHRIGVAIEDSNEMNGSSNAHGSPCLTPTRSDSQLEIPSLDKDLIVVLAEGSKPASHCSSPALRTDDEGVSQNTFHTAQQSIPSVGAESESSDAQKDCKVEKSAVVETTRQTAVPQTALTSLALDSVVTARQVLEELSLLIALKDQLELIFGCSGMNALELQQSLPGSVDIDQDLDVTNAAVASIPFVDTAQTGNDLPEEVTSDEIPCIVYLPTSSTFGESSSHEHISFVAGVILSDENSSLGSQDSYIMESCRLPKVYALDEANATEANTLSNGPVYASMIASALEEHASSLDRIRLESRVNEDSPNTMVKEPKELELTAPFDELHEEAVAVEEHTMGIGVTQAQVMNDAESAATFVLKDMNLNARSDLEGEGYETPVHEQFENRPCHQNPVDEVEPENLKRSVPEEFSHLQGTEGSSDDEIETFQTAAQSSWEQDVFGLSVSEVKADFMLVLEEVTGVSPVNTSSESYRESHYKMCGGCAWLARLMCW